MSAQLGPFINYVTQKGRGGIDSVKLGVCTAGSTVYKMNLVGLDLSLEIWSAITLVPDQNYR